MYSVSGVGKNAEEGTHKTEQTSFKKKSTNKRGWRRTKAEPTAEMRFWKSYKNYVKLGVVVNAWKK